MKSYFFDAHVTGIGDDGAPVYDREYEAADHADFYRGFFSNGLFLVPDKDAAKVTSSGAGQRFLHVAAGRAFISGYQGITDGTDEFETTALADGRYRVVIRLDRSEDVRAFSCELVFGSATQYPELVRDGNVYDLCLANVIIASGAPTVEDTRLDPALCGALSFADLPAYYPPGIVPELLWLYTYFPSILTTGEIAQVESNPQWMATYDSVVATQAEAEAGALAKIRQWPPLRVKQAIIAGRKKELIATFLASGTFNIASYGLEIGDKIDIFMGAGGGSGGGGGQGSNYSEHGGSGAGGGRCVFIIDFIIEQAAYPLLVGAGGASAPFSNGATGGSTTGFGRTMIGGSGGTRSNANSSGGAGGSGGGGRASGNSGIGGAGGSRGANGGYGKNSYGENAGAGGNGTGETLDYSYYNPYTKKVYGGGGGGGAGVNPISTGGAGGNGGNGGNGTPGGIGQTGTANVPATNGANGDEGAGGGGGAYGGTMPGAGYGLGGNGGLTGGGGGCAGSYVEKSGGNGGNGVIYVYAYKMR